MKEVCLISVYVFKIFVFYFIFKVGVVFTSFVVVLCMHHMTDGLVTPIPMPMTLYDCLDRKADTANISVIPARTIQSLCISKFIETTSAWSPNITDPNVINYISSLLRKVVRESELSDAKRQKRQVFGGPVRREVRAAPYQFNWRRFAIAVRRLKNSFVSIHLFIFRKCDLKTLELVWSWIFPVDFS